MSNVPNRQNWQFNLDVKFDTFDKNKIVDLYIRRMLIRTQKIFKYNNLPKTIPQKDLELILQCNGSATIAKVNGELYAFNGGLGGTPNPYYLPTVSIVSNPALNYTNTLVIDKDCVVILNDALYLGLMPLLQHNAYLLAECDISFKFATVNMRIPAIMAVPDDNTKEDALEFFKQVEDGKKLGVIGDSSFFDKIAVYNYANSSTNIQHLIELKQYIIGTFYQDLGIQSQFNMKREAINEAEAALSTDILYPTIDEMLTQRQEGVNKINKMFGTNITVELDSVWAQLRKQQKLAFELQESEIDENSSNNEEVDNNEQND